MRVLLINPPRFNELVGKNPAMVEEHRGFNPPLGILSLAGYLETHSEHEVEVMDTQPYGWGYDELEGILARKTADVVGITAMTFTLIDVIKTVNVIRKVMPNATVVLGGPHVHLFPNETMDLDGVDYLIQGEGEIAFLNFLNNLHDFGKLREIVGLVYRDPDSGEVVNNGIAQSTQNLDELGFPARHLIDVTKYTSLLGKSDVVTTMFTSRGCPYRCTFCDRPYSPVISGFRWRSAKHVADEMEMCIDLGIHEAFIYDDTFTVRKDRVLDLCEEIEKRKLDFRWDVRAHVNTVTPDLMQAMRRAGCDRIHFGVEVGNDRMMKTIKKNANVERVKGAFKAAREAGMETLGYFIVGQQTETRADVMDSIRLAQELDPNYVHFTIFCPYPGTEIYMKGLEAGVIKYDVWREFAKNPQPGYELPVWEEKFTRDEMREMLVDAYKTFYLRPGFLARSVSRIRSVGEFKRKFKAGLSVVGMNPEQVANLDLKVRKVVPGAAYDVYT